MKRQIPFDCHFKTPRLIVRHLSSILPENLHMPMGKRIAEILSPEVTQYLPPDWQQVHTANDGIQWLTARLDESLVAEIRMTSGNRLIGFILIYVEAELKGGFDIRFGYLISADSWGRRLGSELIEGLIDWSRKCGRIRSLTGGGEPANVGSIKVMERAGFQIVSPDPAAKPGETIFYEYRFDGFARDKIDESK